MEYRLTFIIRQEAKMNRNLISEEKLSDMSISNERTQNTFSIARTVNIDV